RYDAQHGAVRRGSIVWWRARPSEADDLDGAPERRYVMSPANVEIVHRFFDAFERRDREAVAGVLHPHVEWHSMGAPLVGVEAIHGRDEAVRFMFEQIAEGIEDFRAILEEVRELPGDQVLTVARYDGRGIAS